MIDLSFLTEEEQKTIAAVLKRDAELKKAEAKRIQWVSKSVYSVKFLNKPDIHTYIPQTKVHIHDSKSKVFS